MPNDKDSLMSKVAALNAHSAQEISWRETFSSLDLRSFGKPPRFDQRDPGKTFAKVLPGVSAEEAQAMVKRFFALWPESARYLEQVRKAPSK